jgi:adenylate cyclase
MEGRLRRTVLLGLAVGALGVALSIIPSVLELEEQAGLAWLFDVRGPLAPPSDVAVVSIDGESAEALGLTSHVDRWPRALHADLIDRLSAAGAVVIAFDVMFDTERDPEGDRRLAGAVEAAANVVLLERVQSETIDLAGVGGDGAAVVERRVPPIEPLRRAALATAPFTLPKVPIRVGQFWTFGRTAGGTATLPVVVLHGFDLPALDEFFALLASVRPGVFADVESVERHTQRHSGLEETIRQVEDAFRRDPQLGEDVERAMAARSFTPARLRLFRALVDAYSGAGSRYINYYGPARTIETVPYHEVLNGLEPSELTRLFRGRAVFVGFSEIKRPERQQDWFYSVFSKDSGQDLSGVEIAASAFANLLDGSSVRPLPLPFHWLLVFAWGFALAAVAAMLPALAALPAALAGGAIFAWAASAVFARSGIWPPLIVPLLVQLPAALFLGLLWSHQSLKRQREKIRAALGYYLPERAIKRLAHETAGVGTTKELVFGTCLVTDAEQYTALSESLPPEELGRFMDEYYRSLLNAVGRHGGIVSDLAGDSMVAVWAATRGGAAAASDACRAAQDVQAAVERFNERSERRLPTRIGLDSGQLLLGNIGSEVRGEYRAVGDIVNTAARLQGLNRHLGTRVLLSGATLRHIHGFHTRFLGDFLLVGKSVPVAVFELLGAEGGGGAFPRDEEEEFAASLQDFRSGRWRAAATRFEDLLRRGRVEGPCSFYLDLCIRLEASPPRDWSGVVRMTQK